MVRVVSETGLLIEVHMHTYVHVRVHTHIQTCMHVTLKSNLA